MVWIPSAVSRASNLLVEPLCLVENADPGRVRSSV